MTATPHNGKEGDFQLFMACWTPTALKGETATGFTRSTLQTSCVG